MKIAAKVDVIGIAAKEFFEKRKASNIKVRSSIKEDSIIPVPYLFRNLDEMPEIERVALSLCKGKVLEIGAGVGSHALELQKMNLEVVALDNSAACCEVALQRGVKQVLCAEFKDEIQGKFDTILMMMNGIGVCGTIAEFELFLKRAKGMLQKGGQIIFDSCDILYMFLNDDGSMNFDLNGAYYGEVEYVMSYKKHVGETFKWLFIDEHQLKSIAQKHHYQIDIVFKEEEGMYLAKLTL